MYSELQIYAGKSWVRGVVFLRVSVLQAPLPPCSIYTMREPRRSPSSCLLTFGADSMCDGKGGGEKKRKRTEIKLPCCAAYLSGIFCSVLLTEPSVSYRSRFFFSFSEDIVQSHIKRRSDVGLQACTRTIYAH
ncbi:hypothetical protein Y032_0324g2531 [Ancylostoma ceylanicum]|uniref:Uncharacterized protein n=1 Tax=Ancylostoma ceylanicum TaxID=53326 RepID=A0A016S088_9BILA|nr:hypothetical protein Y032_0324g2531 [Ancylostoma ceylanicum]